jgi:hypothetical protein
MRGVRDTHLIGDFHCLADLYERTLPYAGAVVGSACPLKTIFDKLWPERKEAALHRLYRMDATTALSEEVTLRTRWLAEPQCIPGANDIPALELFQAEFEESCDLADVRFRNINPSLHATTVRAAPDTFESQAIHLVQLY